MKYLERDRNGWKLKGDAWNIDVYIKLETDDDLENEEIASLLAREVDFLTEEEALELVESDYLIQYGNVILLLVDGEGTNFTEKEMIELDNHMQQ